MYSNENHIGLLGGKLNQHEINERIEVLITDKDSRNESYSTSELDFINQYEGSGGQASKGGSGQGLLHEFFTPDYLCDLMWKLARKHGYTSGKVLEPSCGTGRFIKYANRPKDVVGFEISKISARIAYLTNTLSKTKGSPIIHNQYFETAFMESPRHTMRLPKFSTWLKEYPFSLVIGNPPYGAFKTFYSSFFKKPRIIQVEHFFMLYGLQLLKKGGLMVFVTASSFLDNGNTYTPIRKEMEQLCTLEEAFRLPPVFRFSQVPTDILIFRRK